MNEYELRLVTRKKRKLRELHQARLRVQRLERELQGEPQVREETAQGPEFLTQLSRTAHRLAALRREDASEYIPMGRLEEAN